MRTYPFAQVDAFTTTPLGGNPCAIVFDADDLRAETMQAIAQEMNLSETAFVLRSTVADVRARYFTPESEIPLAGHPTIATIHALVESGRIAMQGHQMTVQLELRDGPIAVDVTAHGGNPTFINMTQRKPQFLNTLPATTVMPIWGLNAEDALPGYPIQVVSTGTPQLMIPVKNHDVLRRIAMQESAYRQLSKDAAFFSAHIFCLGGVTPTGDTFARHLAPFEDPFTGSATGGMGAYLWHYSLLDKATFIAEQGHWMKRPGQATVEVVGDRNAIETVKVGGPAVTILRGELFL